jgi:hypothetical protein
MSKQMSQEDLEGKLHRTWLEYLVASNQRDIAALAIDAEAILTYESYNDVEVIIDLPLFSYLLLEGNGNLENSIIESFRFVSRGRIFDGNSNLHDDCPISFRLQLIEVESDWKDIIRELITNKKDANQGVVTETVYLRKGKQPLIYNEMKFATQSEIRVAQELENRKILFFPLPLAVRNDTGNRYQDHREADFLVCDDGSWGILEISHHLNRYEKDSEKDVWFKKSGILCIQHYTTERCYNQTKNVIDEFLSILAKYRR